MPPESREAVEAVAGPITVVLTKEQKERIRENRERALEIRKRRKLELERQGLVEGEAKCRKSASDTDTERRLGRKAFKDTALEDDPASLELEDFEIDASPWVTKTEVKKMYCLPEGTLAVCAYEERPNPQRKGWKPMKLYDRAEIRRRARERYGGLQGLIDERRKRNEKTFEKDLEKAKKMFV